ncbi:tRNA (adenosine(37)-N6)-threonylcarbamoyltransferase complex ATPase subunit type 1 TsaE [Legionella sp. CNM-4043-24]|uniref:tRNA (adenosine(37)-N6)-threonylcarbamoyltransferase complex ATPase subunit type 1 TsaE n=1 Tax=Legionella sp. CNM-4043-24 TaxID=3421646 RepID=UPI00403AF0F2
MTIQTFELADESASIHLAASFAGCLTAPAVLSFQGEIGAGKTTFIRAMLRALGVTGAIKSPTFSLVESYDCQGLQIHHFDLYRIEDETELEYLGFRDYFTDQAVSCIEWPERAAGNALEVDLRFALAIPDHGRILTIEALSQSGENMLACLAGKL